MLTQEGQQVAQQCLLRSGLADPIESLAPMETAHLDRSNMLDLDSDHADLDEEDALHSFLDVQKKSVDTQLGSIEKVHYC